LSENATSLANAIAAAQAALDADEVVRGTPPGTPGRRQRMKDIIHAQADAFGVERVDLTMALTQASAARRAS
jgi:hypothetical protein